MRWLVTGLTHGDLHKASGWIPIARASTWRTAIEHKKNAKKYPLGYGGPFQKIRIEMETV